MDGKSLKFNLNLLTRMREWLVFDRTKSTNSQEDAEKTERESAKTRGVMDQAARKNHENTRSHGKSSTKN
jgi:hypothetical protein